MRSGPKYLMRGADVSSIAIELFDCSSGATVYFFLILPDKALEYLSFWLKHTYCEKKYLNGSKIKLQFGWVLFFWSMTKLCIFAVHFCFTTENNIQCKNCNY